VVCPLDSSQKWCVPSIPPPNRDWCNGSHQQGEYRGLWGVDRIADAKWTIKRQVAGGCGGFICVFGYAVVAGVRERREPSSECLSKCCETGGPQTKAMYWTKDLNREFVRFGSEHSTQCRNPEENRWLYAKWHSL